VTWCIGGTAGAGVESGGEAFARALASLGYLPSTQRNFPSRIRGGDTTFTVRVTAGGYLAPGPVQLGIVLNDTVKVEADLVLVDGEFPFTELAKQSGSRSNMVALGASAFLFGMHLPDLASVVGEQFARKGEKVVAANAAALQAGFDEAKARFHEPKFTLATPKEGNRLLLSGNQAASLGALAAGCRFVAAYPITPASDVLEFMTPHIHDQGGIALQMEDEMAALNACIGAAFAGARSLTATSGPGISLMTETMGLAGSTETPVVVLDCQRPGPSTGMPTKHSQDDIWHLCLGGHGEEVRIVLAPMDVRDAFFITSEAFRLAWQFRAPAFVALDQQCSLMKQTVEAFDIPAEAAKHGREPVAHEGNAWDGGFAPYGGDAVPIPGEPGPYLSNSTEHGPNGLTTEVPAVRKAMVERRLGIMQDIVAECDTPVYVEGDGDIVIVTSGSTTEAAREAAANIGARVAAIRLLWPFPVEAVRAAIGDRRVIVAEANSLGQLAALLKMHLPVHDRLTECKRYDGNPLSAADVEACL
jgi:2-oxoglutarate ferredoxin oxidoreductase subunit alpha